ncbi:hypothetical protein pb186bvf_003446 [Paramecium bursaria]
MLMLLYIILTIQKWLIQQSSNQQTQQSFKSTLNLQQILVIYVHQINKLLGISLNSTQVVDIIDLSMITSQFQLVTNHLHFQSTNQIRYFIQNNQIMSLSHRKLCDQQGHKRLTVYDCCTYIDCKQPRWLCSKCYSQNLHAHDKQNDDHIMNQIRFSQKITQDIKALQDPQTQELLTAIKSNVHEVNKYIQDAEREIKNLSQIISDTLQNLIRQTDQVYQQDIKAQIQENKFYDLGDQMIDQMLQLGQQQLTQRKLSIIKLSVDKLQDRLALIQQSCTRPTAVQSQLKLTTCQVENIFYATENNLSSAAISNDLKYIIAGGVDSELMIWNYSSLQLLETIKLQQWISSCIFSDDSQSIFVGDFKGNIYQYVIEDVIFMQNFQLKLHDDAISNIVYINKQFILTSSDDGIIIKLDCTTKTQQYKIRAHRDSVLGLDYDRIRNFIVSSSEDRQLKLYDGNSGKLLIDRSDDNIICQLQIINNSNQLLTLDHVGHLKLYAIDLEKKDILIIRLITKQQDVMNFSLVLYNYFIVIVCKQIASIFGLDGQHIRTIDHNIDDKFTFGTLQVNSLKAILVRGLKQLSVIKLDLDIQLQKEEHIQ